MPKYKVTVTVSEEIFERVMEGKNKMAAVGLALLEIQKGLLTKLEFEIHAREIQDWEV